MKYMKCQQNMLKKKSKKNKKKQQHVTVWKQFCPAFGFSRDKKDLCDQND